MGNSRIDELEDLDKQGDEDSESEPEPEPESESGEGVEQKPGTETEAEPDEQPPESTDSESMSTSTEDNGNEEAESIESESPPIEESDPAFSGDDFSRQTIYRLDSTWEDYQDAMDELDLMVMRREIGVRNVTQREREEAMVRMAMDHPRLLGEYVMKARGFEVDLTSDE